MKPGKQLRKGIEDHVKPLYRQVRDAIAKDIRDRNLAAHSLYLSESEAMAKYGVSRVTIRQAFKILEDDHLLYRAHGKGTYVAPTPPEATKTVAFLATCVLRSGVETVMLRSIEEYFDARDVSLIICNHEDSFTRAERYIKRLVTLGVDGIIHMAVSGSANYEKNAELLEYALKAGIPCIQIDRYVDSLNDRVISVRPDNFGGSKKMTNHLIALGNQRIAFCGNRSSSAVRDRREGCREALKEAGLDLPREFELDVLTEKDYRSVALQIRVMQNRPTAIACVNDDMAIRLISALQEVGIKVPEEIAVVGFDDYSPFGQPSWGLSTVRVGHWEEGRIAASAMVDLLSGKKLEPKPFIIPVDLVIRGSCGSLIQKRREGAPAVPATA